jgi:hypothetical protein
MLMTSKLYVRDINKINNLIQWCQDNLDKEQWELEVLAMLPPHYKFKFMNPQLVTMAALAS